MLNAGEQSEEMRIVGRQADPGKIAPASLLDLASAAHG